MKFTVNTCPFKLEDGKRIYCELELKDDLYVRKDFKPDLSFTKEWSTSYKKVEPFIKDQIVLDIGANIGIFSRRACQLGVKQIYSYEPEPGAFSVLRQNVPSGHLFNKAVGKEEGKVNLNFSQSGNTVIGSTVFNKRGRQSIEVDQVAFESIVNKHKPTLIKSDCEGSELYWLYGDSLPEHVKVVTAELHRESVSPGFNSLCDKVIR